MKTGAYISVGESNKKTVRHWQVYWNGLTKQSQAGETVKKDRQKSDGEGATFDRVVGKAFLEMMVFKLRPKK